MRTGPRGLGRGPELLLERCAGLERWLVLGPVSPDLPTRLSTRAAAALLARVLGSGVESARSRVLARFVVERGLARGVTPMDQDALWGQLRAALEIGALAVVETETALRVDGSVSVPGPGSGERPDLAPGGLGPPGLPRQVGTYELQILDEHDAPLAGIAVDMNTPAGAETVLTDDEGVARMEGPTGRGSAVVADVEQLREQLAQAHHGPSRESPVEPAPDLHLRTLATLQGPVALSAGSRQRLLLVTRFDLEHHEDEEDDEREWGPLSLDAGDAAAVHEWDDLRTRIQVHADGLHRQLHVVGELAAPLDYAPPELEPPEGEAGRWEAPDVYIVQSGDTLVKIAATYLGSGARWTEIWALNQGAYLGRSPDQIYPGDRFHMPADGIPAWLILGDSPPGPLAEAPPVEPPTWLSVDVDVLLEALVEGSLDLAANLLSSIGADLPEPADEFPPPLAETALVDAFLLARALDGQVDPPMPATSDEFGHLP